MSKYLVTGTAGFIGFHLADAILEQGDEVVGLDNINDYYDVKLKYSRLQEAGIVIEEIKWNKLIQSRKYASYRFVRMCMENKNDLLSLFSKEKFEYVIHLAAQAGVRYSIDNPDVYIQSNIVGFFNLLEACRHYPIKYLLYASSSSVYGNNEKVPFCEDDNVDHPVSLYAATKKSNELMAYTYNNLYHIQVTGLRFFTVYGPWGRPDMAVYKFAEAIINNKPIQVYSEGELIRDFTYIGDIINGITGLLKQQRHEQPDLLMNIGNNNPVSVNDLINEIERCLDKKSLKVYMPMQQGDVIKTFADIRLINSYCGFIPKTSLRDGLLSFCRWYLDYVSLKTDYKI